MRIKIRSLEINRILERALPLRSELLPRDPLIIRQLKRLEKKTFGKIKLEQRINFNSFPIQKIKKKHYQIWEI